MSGLDSEELVVLREASPRLTSEGPLSADSKIFSGGLENWGFRRF